MKLVLQQIDSGCIISTSHKLNPDGYLRKRIDNKLVMYHRHVWEQHNGPIPEGYEVDHKCRNRACCNIDHLQLLGISEHKVKTNKERYRERFEKARAYWIDTGCNGYELGEVFDVTWSCGYRWIRMWKREGAETISKESTGHRE